jgi:hypothetical protein
MVEFYLADILILQLHAYCLIQSLKEVWWRQEIQMGILKMIPLLKYSPTNLGLLLLCLHNSSVSKMQLVWHAELFLCLSTSEGRFFVLLHEGTLVMSYFPKQMCSYYYVLP